MLKTKCKKIISIILNSLLYVFMFFCLISLMVVIGSKKTNSDAVSVFGYQMRRVISPSMAECEHTDVSGYDIKSLPVNTMVFIENVPKDEMEAKKWIDDLDIGDVLTFKYVFVRQEVITHRIYDIKENGKGGYYIYLRGDNVNTPEGGGTQIIDTSNVSSSNFVIGKVVGQSYILGSIVALLTSTVGMVFLIILPIILIIIFEVFRIYRLLTYEKRRIQKEKEQTQLEEIENLRKKIEQLEKNAKGSE
jgi:signal peptidase